MSAMEQIYSFKWEWRTFRTELLMHACAYVIAQIYFAQMTTYTNFHINYLLFLVSNRLNIPQMTSRNEITTSTDIHSNTKELLPFYFDHLIHCIQWILAIIFQVSHIFSNMLSTGKRLSIILLPITKIHLYKFQMLPNIV